MPTIADLVFTNNMVANRKPFLTDIVESITSVQTHINDKVADNLVQHALDSYGSAYTFDNDGLAQYTNNLYDKLTATDTYTGGDFTLTTTGAWTDVDATNASIAFTPEIAGDFRVTFQFSFESVSSNATNETDIRFRLTDSTTNSDALPRIKLVTGVSGTNFTYPVHLSYAFDALSAAAKTVKLQYYLTTRTNATLKLLANSNDPICIKSEKI